MAKNNEWKNRKGVVYSTLQNFPFQTEQGEEAVTIRSNQQQLKIRLDQHNRAGKKVTIITGFIGRTDDLEALAKILKTKCGVGGSVKNGDIILQGDFREKAEQALAKEGYKVRRY